MLVPSILCKQQTCRCHPNQEPAILRRNSTASGRVLWIQVIQRKDDLHTSKGFWVVAGRKMCWAGEWRQEEMPQRQMIIGFRQDIGEMMRQMDRTLQLIKSVDSLVEGDELCQLARTMNTGDVMPEKFTSSY